MLCKPQTLEYVFYKREQLSTELQHNQQKQKMNVDTLLPLVNRPHSGVIDRCNNIFCYQKIQVRITCCIKLSCLFGLFQSGILSSLPWIFMIFMLLKVSLVILQNFLWFKFVQCFLMIILRSPCHKSNTEFLSMHHTSLISITDVFFDIF